MKDQKEQLKELNQDITKAINSLVTFSSSLGEQKQAYTSYLLLSAEGIELMKSIMMLKMIMEKVVV